MMEPIEQETGLPVVAALQAMVWTRMRLVGLEPKVEGYGRLLRQSLPD
ncbi:MAG: hypothetical protein ACE5IZ_00380 [Dehalococcoidia bacterium]